MVGSVTQPRRDGQCSPGGMGRGDFFGKDALGREA